MQGLLMECLSFLLAFRIPAGTKIYLYVFINEGDAAEDSLQDMKQTRVKIYHPLFIIQ